MTEREMQARLTPRIVLGETLRDLRERNGLSLREVSSRTTFNHTYIGRVERGEQLPSEALIRTLGKEFGEERLLQQLLSLARESSLQDYSRVTARKEATATRIEVFTSSTFPGLLQTPEYMRALFQAARPRESAQNREDSVSARVARRATFEREEPPLFWSIIDESALRRPVGGAQVMAGQLQEIIAAAASPWNTIQVLPFGAGAHGMLGGSLTLLTMPNGESLAYVESFASGELAESPQRVTELRQGFDVVRANALPEHDSIQLLKSIQGEYSERF